MELLTTLTLIYVAILVLAVAASLIIILYYLWRIGTALEATREALAAVADATETLDAPMALLQQKSAAWAQQTAEAEASLTEVEEALGALTGEPAGAERR
ncbi:MAG: hypothetical protein R3272_16160 [Candidatus Promineifilaceae bacterium]|nr:hypothetical protein [Candidatus Promineifilaceae bacterium]